MPLRRIRIAAASILLSAIARSALAAVTVPSVPVIDLRAESRVECTGALASGGATAALEIAAPPGQVVMARVLASDFEPRLSALVGNRAVPFSPEAYAAFTLTAPPEGRILLTLQSSAEGGVFDLEIRAPRLDEGERVFAADFEREVASAWAPRRVNLTPVGDRGFLGEFHEETATLTLSDLPPHALIGVAMDLFAIRSWDGNDFINSGPDIWEAWLRGGPLMLRTTFDNHATGRRRRQAYPDLFPGGLNPPMTGAAEINVLGYGDKDRFGDGPMNAVYRLQLFAPHTSDEAVIEFSASLPDNPRDMTNESWGLDNVEVYVFD